MKKDDTDSAIQMILKESGLNKTSDEFSAHLNKLVLEQSERNLVQQDEVNSWLGKALVGIALIWLMIFFYYGRPISILTAIPIAVIAFILGFWILFVLIRKSLISRIDSI